MTERETKTLKTANGAEVIYNSYITGGEFKQRQDLVLKYAKPKGTLDANGDPEFDVDLSDAFTSKLQDQLIQMLVVSVNGVKGNVLSDVNNLPVKDYQEVVAALNEIANDVSSKKQ